MINVKAFTFNPFQVNTFLLYDESRECIIIDAGCFEDYEKEEITAFIREKQLVPVQLYNTHCHIDHILGNSFLANKYNIGITIHNKGIDFIKSAQQSAMVFGLQTDPPALPTSFIDEGSQVKFGSSTLEILYTPGHADGSICFYSPSQHFVIVGDVLFSNGIGRTDLPTGNYDLLIDSIRSKLFSLDDKTLVYPGHGPETTIGEEKESNYFLS